MRFFIFVENADETWNVRIAHGAPGQQEISNRPMRRCGAGGRAFPQPPTDEVKDIDPQQPHYRLCATTDADDIFDAYADIVAKNPPDGAAVAFGRYLFAAIIGDEAWRKICAAAGNEAIELALSIPQSERVLHRLPWEMIHADGDFLAAQLGRGAITRLVAGAPPLPTAAPHEPPTLTLKPRVLFVVGADLSDARVRPGTEYLGLLRRMKDQDITLETLVLQRATTDQLEKEMERFSPSIVHFICHGWFDNNQGYLELAPAQPAAPPARLFAADLLHLLKTKGGLPLVVVLNACYTANLAPDSETTPLAAELVQGGVPMVVGMAGRVADLACRLFTWRFYEALLKGESVTEATAHGRRAGIKHSGYKPEKFIDWALPNLYLAERSSTCVSIDQDWAACYKQRQNRAELYRTKKKPPLFCDREELLETYRTLLSGGAPPTVLAVNADSWDVNVNKPQYGKERLLGELAAQAVRDGHLPCLVTFADGATIPATPIAVGLEILNAARTTRDRFNLDSKPASAYELRKLNSVIKQEAKLDILEPSLQEELEWGATLDSGKVVGAALRLDLKALAKDARKALGAPGLKALVLIDDVHKFDGAARSLVEEMVTPSGLGTTDNPIPLIFAFMGVAQFKPEYAAAINLLKNFAESGKDFVVNKYLRALPSPKEDGLLYQQFLLHQEPPLVIRTDSFDESTIADMLDELHNRTRGLPSQLLTDEVEAAIYMAKRLKVLEEANDEQILRQQL